MKIRQEFNINGDTIRGRVKDDWSKSSKYVFKLEAMKRSDSTFEEEELENLVKELNLVLDKIKDLNKESKEAIFDGKME